MLDEAESWRLFFLAVVAVAASGFHVLHSNIDLLRKHELGLFFPQPWGNDMSQDTL